MMDKKNWRRELEKYLYLYLEGDKWRVVPSQLESLLEYLAVSTYCDQSFKIYCFPMSQFSSLQELRGYVEPKSRGRGFGTNHAGSPSKKLSEFLEQFCCDWGYLLIGDRRYKFDNGIPWSKIKFHELSCVEIDELVKDLIDIENIYSLYLPSDDLEFSELDVIYWDGNERRITAKDTKFWYYIWWSGS